VQSPAIIGTLAKYFFQSVIFSPFNNEIDAPSDNGVGQLDGWNKHE